MSRRLHILSSFSEFIGPIFSLLSIQLIFYLVCLHLSHVIVLCSSPPCFSVFTFIHLPSSLWDSFSFIGFRRTYPFYYSSIFLSSALTSRQCSNLGFKSIFIFYYDVIRCAPPFPRIQHGSDSLRESASRSAALLANHVVSQQYCIFCWLNYDQVGWWLVVWNATTPKTFMSFFFTNCSVSQKEHWLNHLSITDWLQPIRCNHNIILTKG